MISTNEVEFLEVPMARGDRITGNYNPVVIITTKDRQGRSNAAPIAMCMEVCHNPVLLAFSVGKDKDTCRNVEETGEFVINVPGENILKEMMVTQHNKALIIFIVFFMRSNFDCLGMKDTAHSGERRR